jgi:glycosyltransferase involved in cell wall biosynthesis
MDSVTFVIGQLVLGGAEKQLYLLAKGLFQRGWKVSVISLHAGCDDYWEKPIQDLGIPFSAVSTHSRLRAIIQMSSFLKEHPSKILHSWSTFTGLYTLLLSRITGTPIIIGSQRSTEQLSIRELGPFLYRLSYTGFKGITVNSHLGLRELQKRWPKSDICFIPNGINDFQETPSNDGRKKVYLRKKFNIPEDMLVVGGVGAVIQAKRFDLLIDAIKSLQQKQVDCGLVIIGDGPLKQELIRKAQKDLRQGTFFFLGFIPEAEELMEMFDIFCLTSDVEGTPNVVMEALASGLPVISTNVGDVSEIIDNGVNGIIVPSNHPEIIAQNIHSLVDSPDFRIKISWCAREKILHEFSTERMVDTVVDFYKKIESTKSKSGK